MILTPEQMAEATGGRLVRGGGAGRLLTDTRKLAAGDWFLALRGDRFDGHDYLEEAIRRGAVGVIVEQAPEGWAHGLLLVKDTLVALQDCARFARSLLSCPVVAITGSAGKTTTRAMVAEVLAALGPVHQNEANLNNQIGVPLTLLATPEGVAAVVLEMGMRGPNQIALLQDIGRPTVRIITNVGPAHVETVGSIEGIARCKQEMFDGARPGDVVLVCEDDPFVRAMPVPVGARVLRYGSSKGCDIQLIASRVDGRAFTTELSVETPAGPLHTTLGVPGQYLALNATAAVAAGFALGVAPEAMAAGLARYAPVGQRMRVERRKDLTILHDYYNANPASMRAALETLACAVGVRRVALLGDMLELGVVEEAGHAEIATLAGQLGLELVGLAGPRFAPHAAACRAAGAGEVVVASSSGELGAMIREKVVPGDVVLIKGSRGSRMEQVLHSLDGAES